MATNDGGPAFPCMMDDVNEHGRDGEFKPRPGQSLRAYFAAKALQGLLANPGGPIQANSMSGFGWCNCKIEDVCGFAVGLADALITELATPKPSPVDEVWEALPPEFCMDSDDPAACVAKLRDAWIAARDAAREVDRD